MMTQGFTEGCEIDACPAGCSAPRLSACEVSVRARVQEVAATEWLGTLNTLALRTMSQDSEGPEHHEGYKGSSVRRDRKSTRLNSSHT